MCFSQTSYPKKILWENDTVLAISKQQLILINRTLNEYSHLKEMNRFLQRDLCVSDSLTLYWKHVALNADTLYLLEAKKFHESQKLNAIFRRSIREQTRKTKKVGIGVGIGGTLLGVLLGVLLGK